MIYSKTCEYAMRALMYLATKPEQEFTRLNEVCRETGLPGPYISKIFQSLVHDGILKSLRGPVGGFSLSRPAEQITLMQIVEAIDDMEMLRECLMGLDACEDENPCPLHSIWKNTKEEIRKELEETTLRHLTEQAGQYRFRNLNRARLKTRHAPAPEQTGGEPGLTLSESEENSE